MPNYNEAQGVADLLSKFDFNIISDGPGDFSTQHRKYTCEFSKPGIESFTTTYQSNPDVHGQPTATDVFAALASDALAVDGLLVDTFADELGSRSHLRPSAPTSPAIRPSTGSKTTCNS